MTDEEIKATRDLYLKNKTIMIEGKRIIIKTTKGEKDGKSIKENSRQQR